jgi:2-polyprenyl-3-methyl-5-hydroxy-6-metoxy-1,4-benzoquinol methylase
MAPNTTLPPGYRSLLEAAATRHYRDTLGLPRRQLETSVRSRMTMHRGRRVVALLQREVGLGGLRVLDVGSGWGEVTYMCRQAGARAYGVEPSATSAEVAQTLAGETSGSGWFVRGVGERLPFADASFDVVVCHHVIEHVRSPARVVRELVRVVRPGGSILLAFPNYVFPFEGHYRLPWIPMLPKALGALVLRAAGRDPAFLLTSINYVTYRGVRRLLRSLPVEVRSLTEERRAATSRSWAGRLALLAERLLRAYPTVTLLLTRRGGAPFIDRPPGSA